MDRRPKRPSVWVLAAAAVLLAGAAGASSAWLEFGAGRAYVSAPVVTESAASAPGKVDRSVSVESPSEPALESPKPPGAAAGDSVQKSLGPSVESTLAPAIETPAALFAKANQLRRQGKDQQAIEIYQRLQQRFSALRRKQGKRESVGLGA